MQRAITFILAGLFAAVTAFAQDDIDFDRHDRDNDGYLSESEWNAVGNAGVEFDMIDTNRDGRLDKAEVKAGMSQQEERPVSRESVQQPQQPEMLSVSGGEGQPRNVAMYDANEDGRVSRGEARKDGELMTWFVIWDTNQDGYLNQDELAEGAVQDGRQPGNTARDGQQRDPAADAGQPRGDRDQSFEQADANGDDRVSRTEANEAGAQYIAAHFDALDANRDNHVDRSEAAAAGARRGSGFDGQNRFDAYDVNHDGYLDEDEAMEDSYLDSSFDAWDINDDSVLDETEVGEDWLEWSEDAFDAHDINGDGRLDPEEAGDHDYINYSFDEWDADEDGYLSEDETVARPLQDRRR